MNTPWNLALRGGFPLIAGLLLSACHKEPSSLDTTDITGVYALVSVNAKPVPADISHEGVSQEHDRMHPSPRVHRIVCEIAEWFVGLAPSTG